MLQDAVGLLLIAGDDVGRDLARKERDLALFSGEGRGELAPEVVFLVEEFKAHKARVLYTDVFGSLLDLARVGAEERRRRADELAIDDGEVLGAVMAFPAEAPGALGGRLAKDGYEVVLGVALVGTFALFDDEEQVLEGHDRFDLHVAALAKGDGEQGLGEVALAGIHLLNRQALADGRNKDPVGALRIVEGERRLGTLGVVEGAKEGVGRLGHFFAGAMAEGGRDGQGQNGQDGEDTGEEAHGGDR